MMSMMMGKGKGEGKEIVPTKKYKIDPVTYYVGLWSGLDPLDGAEVNRVFIPTSGNHDFALTGRLQYSQLCAPTRLGSARTITSHERADPPRCY